MPSRRRGPHAWSRRALTPPEGGLGAARLQTRTGAPSSSGRGVPSRRGGAGLQPLFRTKVLTNEISK